ncbi:homoserine kinase [Lentibacillus cibarius]|uniref:Homoserine kinase n=1 Tax=Lentibacillus cibarius TaxID=2583219 RepID=A0A5S3QKJ4_9BACI|nr:homoserine kinase [Lentibacillus cibarius]TMN22454.1 homoserine kinase [Lentibacillus cibarius]
MRPFRIHVPASSANIGPGFDSLGLALGLYLTLDVATAETREVVQCSPHLPEMPTGEDHYIFQIADQTAARWHKELPPCKVTLQSDIPLARGLGSSASAIVAGIELANQLCKLSLSPEDKLTFGNEIEGHPDNIAPSIFGGLTITTIAAGSVDWIQMPGVDADVVVFIPDQDLKTAAARKVLPATYSRELATAGSSVSNVFVASLLSGNYPMAGKMMENDLFHEPYRSDLIPNYNEIRRHAKENGAYGTVISGAGPTMISLFPKGEADAIVPQLQRIFPAYDIKRVAVDSKGVNTTWG